MAIHEDAREEVRSRVVRCVYCGRFCSYGTVRVQHRPDTSSTSELIEYTCKKCQDELKINKVVVWRCPPLIY